MNAAGQSIGIEVVDTAVQVESPEHVRFAYQIAGPWRRLWAVLLDWTVMGIIIGLVASILSAFSAFGELAQGISTGLASIAFFLIQWGYFAVSEALWSGRTLGKKVVGLRVVREDGHPIDATAAVLRNLLRAADFLPFGYALGVVVMSRDRKFRRLGDLAAGTMVVAEERKRQAVPFTLSPPPGADEIAWIDRMPALPHEDLQALDLLIRRGSQLHPQRAQELAEILAPVYARRLGTAYRDAWRFLALLHDRPRRRGGRR
jgi:uncharacterized RDD family membrane protein YckC